jgi:energy-coupling factor transporter ATP-binding protein EcfA2
MSRRYGSTRRNSRSRRLGDSEHDRGSRTAECAAAARLASLTELAKIGFRARTDGFSTELLTEAELLLRRSGERMRMSASHTVVALAGGTGSGKSTLFNALSGANFSPAGVTRPTTKHSHACVWGMEGAAPLLDWLGVQRRHRYARASALDEGEASLNGLLLLDLPDHDSVVSGSAALVDRLVKMADMLVWVLDPLKYADASVHRRYLVPLAGHTAVTTVVLNKADTLIPRSGRRLRVRPAPAARGRRPDRDSGARHLRDHRQPAWASCAACWPGPWRARQAATDRIAADVDALLERFAVYAGDRVPGWQAPWRPRSWWPHRPPRRPRRSATDPPPPTPRHWNGRPGSTTAGSIAARRRSRQARRRRPGRPGPTRPRTSPARESPARERARTPRRTAARPAPLTGSPGRRPPRPLSRPPRRVRRGKTPRPTARAAGRPPSIP